MKEKYNRVMHYEDKRCIDYFPAREVNEVLKMYKKQYPNMKVSVDEFGDVVIKN